MSKPPLVKPILMTGTSVRAILDNRKFQTRRVMKPQPPDGTPLQRYKDPLTGEALWGWNTGFASANGGVIEYRARHNFEAFGTQYVCFACGESYPTTKPCVSTVEPLGVSTCQIARCPYPVGTRLWVREPFANRPVSIAEGAGYNGACIVYSADLLKPGKTTHPDYQLKWKSSIFLPKWAARLWLEVTDARPAPLQSITEEDAQAEGIELLPCTYIGTCKSNSCPRHGVLDPYRTSFRKLWDTLNGKKSPWASNPLVWAYTFKQIDAPGEIPR